MNAIRKAERTAPVTTSSRRSASPSTRASVGSRSSRASATDALELPARILGVDPGEQLGRDLDLVLGGQPRRRGPPRSPPRARRRSWRRGWRRDRRQQHQRQRDPDVADREQPGGVAPGALGHQLAGQGRQRQPIPAPASSCGATVHQAEAAGSSARQPIPPADQQAARPRRASRGPRRPARPQRRDGQHADRERRGERLDAPAGDEQQDHQEDDRGQRRGEQRQRDGGADGDAGAGFGLGAALGATPGIRCRARRARQASSAGEHDRHLGQEDRPPVEELGERAAQRRADRGAEHRGRHPEAAPRAGAASVEQLEARRPAPPRRPGPARRAGPAAASSSRPSRTRATRARTAAARRRRAGPRRPGAPAPRPASSATASTPV